MNSKLLKAKMLIFGDTNKKLAKSIEISPQRLSAKMNETGGAEFTQKEIEKIKNRYNLTPQEINDIFLEIKYLKKIQTTHRKEVRRIW